jgi:hypothetical protein
LFKSEHRSPRRIGRGLRVELREVEPHSRDSKLLSRGGSKMISRVDMLTQIHFLVPEAEEEVEEELSHVSRVVKMGIKPLTAQRGKRTEEKLTSLRRRGVTRTAKMQTAGGRWGCIRFFWHLKRIWVAWCRGADCSERLVQPRTENAK